MNRHSKGLWQRALLLLVGLALIAGCAPQAAPTAAPTQAAAATTAPAQATKAPAEKITLRLESSVYTEAAHKAALDALKAAYEAKNPNVKIEIYGAPYADFWDKLTAEIVAGTEADIVQLQEGNTRYATYAAMRQGEAGAFVNLDKYIKGTHWENDLTGQKELTYNGHYIGFSNYAWGVHGIYYRKSLLDKEGIDPASIKTWDDLRAAAIKLTKPATGDKQAQYGFGMLIGPAPLALSEWEAAIARPVGDGFFFAKEEAPFTPDRVVINSEPVVWAAKFWQGLNFKDHVTSVGHKTKGDVRQQFWKGQVAMTIEGPWFTGMTREAAPDVLANDTGVIPIPKVVYNGKEYVYNANTNAITHLISSKSQHPEEAWKFLEWMASPEGQALVAKSGMIPCNIVYAGSDAYKKMEPLNAKFVDFLSVYSPAMPRPNLPQAGEITQIALDAAQEMFVAGKDCKQSLDTAAERIKKALEK